jgi:hypothetical protein
LDNPFNSSRAETILMGRKKAQKAQKTPSPLIAATPFTAAAVGCYRSGSFMFASILESKHRMLFNRSHSSFSFSFSRSGENENDYENENEPDLSPSVAAAAM